MIKNLNSNALQFFFGGGPEALAQKLKDIDN